MGVVLSEAAHAGHAVKLSRLFPAVDVAEFGESHGEVAIRMRVALVDFDVERAVHRFEEEALYVARFDFRLEFRDGEVFLRHSFEVFALDNRHELRVLVVREVSACAEKPELADMRRENLLVALLVEEFENEVLQTLADNRALRLPEDKPLPHSVHDCEQPHFLAEFAVVAELCLLHLSEVAFKLLFRRESRAVNALQLFVVFVAAVVRARHGEQFERLDALGIVNVRARAEVAEFAVFVEGDFFAVGNVGESAEFEFLLSDFLNLCGSFVAGKFELLEFLVFGNHLFHFGFDVRKVLRREFVVEVEIVVEARFRRGTDVEFCVREKAQNGRRQNV